MGSRPRLLTRVIRNGGCCRTTGSCFLVIVRIASPGLNLTKIKLPRAVLGLIPRGATALPDTPEGNCPWISGALGGGNSYHYEDCRTAESSALPRPTSRLEGVYRRRNRGHGGSGGWSTSTTHRAPATPRGLFFTKPFVVEHLITYSLEPALAATRPLDVFEDEDVAGAL